MKQQNSRGSQINMEQCTDAVGGNRYNLILLASQRAREIMRRPKDNPEVGYSSPSVTALLEIQNGLGK